MVWDNAAAPLPVKFDAANVNVGVVVALGGCSSTTCGQPLVQCYDAEAATAASGLPAQRHRSRPRLLERRQRRPAANDPILRDVTLVPGSCADPYFSSATASCTFGVSARVDFGAADPSPRRREGHRHRRRARR